MKALFCHDHYYYRDGKITLSKGQYSAALWPRYLQYFDHLSIIGRDGGAANQSDTGINICSAQSVDFHLFENTNSLRGMVSGRKKIKQSIADLVRAHDVIILRGISELGLITFEEAQRQGKYVAMEVVSCAWDELWYHGSLKAKIYAPYRYWKQRSLVKNVNAAIYVSNDFLQKRYPRRHGFTSVASNVALAMESFHHKKNAITSPFKIGLIGTLKNKLKGVDIAIDSINILKNHGHGNVILHILGPGDPAPYQEKINQLGLQDHIKLDGILQSGQPVLDWLYNKDLYIQPSFQEGLPRAVIEAMSQSLPIIGSNAGGIPELIDKRWIFKRGNANTLAKKIMEMTSDSSVMKTEGEKNFQSALRYRQEVLDHNRGQFWKQVVEEITI